MLVHWIWLATRQNVSDWMKVQLLQHFRDPEDLFYADEASFRNIDGLTKENLESLRDKNLHQAQWVLRQCEKEKLGVLTFQDAAYPARLKNISDPPVVLYYKGRLPDFDGSPLIGVVGTRRASVYGLTASKRMGYQIAKCGGVVVSGMAKGIDSMAMGGALTAGGTVVGVLGCGADMVYPPSNKDLFADTENYGCILSEFIPGTPPYAWNFPKRNRIISGLSCGVLVVEAPEKSGALITANQALEQGRDVFVVPGNIDVPTFVGSNRLLRDGAIAVSSGWDILSEYEAIFPGKISREEREVHLTVYPDEVQNVANVAQKPKTPKKQKQEKDKKVIDNATKPSYSDVNKDISAFSPEEQRLIQALQSGQRLVDDVIAEVGLPTAKVLSMLTIMEIKGIIRRLPGKRIVLK